MGTLLNSACKAEPRERKAKMRTFKGILAGVLLALTVLNLTGCYSHTKIIEKEKQVPSTTTVVAT